MKAELPVNEQARVYLERRAEEMKRCEAQLKELDLAVERGQCSHGFAITRAFLLGLGVDVRARVGSR